MDSVVYYWDAGAGPRVYRIGGYGAAGSVNIYNPDTNSWTSGPTEPSPAIAYTVDGCLGRNAAGQDIIAIFNDTTSGATTWHIYNIDTNSWATAAVPSGFPSNGLWATDVAAGLPHGSNLLHLWRGHHPGRRQHERPLPLQPRSPHRSEPGQLYLAPGRLRFPLLLVYPAGSAPRSPQRRRLRGRRSGLVFGRLCRYPVL